MFTLPQLQDIMLAAGADDAVALDVGCLDVSFDDLGYDSLARLHIVGQLQTRHRIVIDDDDLAGDATPGSLLARLSRLPDLTAGAA